MRYTVGENLERIDPIRAVCVQWTASPSDCRACLEDGVTPDSIRPARDSHRQCYSLQTLLRWSSFSPNGGGTRLWA